MGDIRFVPLRVEHVPLVRLQGAQQYLHDLTYNSDYARNLAQPGLSWTALDGGYVLGCGGYLPQNRGRAICWTLLSDDIGPRSFIKIHRFVKWLTDQTQRDERFRRLEATVLHDHEEGHRWMRLLGFKHRTILECYDELGQDYDLYDRVRR